MNTLQLVIGNHNYSSWSMRPWVLLRNGGIAFEEICIPLRLPETSERIREHSAAAKVPVLHHDNLTVWDSLAICEYLAETFPALRAWPEDAAARARARALSAEMHSGFAALRQHLPMNCRANLSGYAIPDADARAAVQADIARIMYIWNTCLDASAGGGFLFGDFGIADAMFAPAVMRFVTYAVALDGAAADYVERVQGLPAVRDWVELGRAESEVIEAMERAAPA